jgi:hypothetical protein
MQLYIYNPNRSLAGLLNLSNTALDSALSYCGSFELKAIANTGDTALLKKEISFGRTMTKKPVLLSI